MDDAPLSFATSAAGNVKPSIIKGITKTLHIIIMKKHVAATIF